LTYSLVTRRLNKVVYGGLAYSASSLFLAPEMINPYYTTYILTHRFPNSQYTTTENMSIFTWAWKKLSCGSSAAYNYVNNLFASSPEPPTSPVAPAETTEAIQSPEGAAKASEDGHSGKGQDNTEGKSS
jgi:hypothetical protein